MVQHVTSCILQGVGRAHLFQGIINNNIIMTVHESHDESHTTTGDGFWIQPVLFLVKYPMA